MQRRVGLLLIVLAWGAPTSATIRPVSIWDFVELAFPSPKSGNPFVRVEFSAVFRQGDRVLEPEGFYDGDGAFEVRFMPDREGEWTYRTKSNRDALHVKKERFVCVAPVAGCHGPVHVRNQ